ncbi:MAG: hypothetical protein H6Q90_116 [Deltaproteobacteria bacterium]|nr:hypothetical protein [Deltaproteobacteria bacterium]
MGRLAVLLILVIAACRPETRSPTSPPRSTPPRSTDPELLRTLAVLATSKAPSAAELEQKRRQLDSGQLTIASYVDSLLATDPFANEVAPLIVLRQFLSQDGYGAPLGFTLSHTDGPRPVYYLDKPCSWDEAVPVQPWWLRLKNRQDTIRVCPDSYQPDRWVTNPVKGEPELSCLSLSSQIDRHGCACGPNLMRCQESAPHLVEIQQSLRDEIKRTIAFSVAQRRPIEQIFTANETFRDRNAEFLLRWHGAEVARHPLTEDSLRELAGWPAEGTWAPRDALAPGQHAGIITAPQIIHFTLDRRQRMTAIYDVLWCMDPDSVGASPESLLSIVGADLQIKSDGWEKLAARPVCTNCHARLDYGFQFFMGFPNDNLQAYFTPALQRSGRGPLYVHDIDDPRGEAELTPHGFAELAVAQPEFRHCMARDFAEYALGNRVTPDAVAAVEARFGAGPTTPRDLMRVALQTVVDSWPTRGVSPAVGDAAAPAGRAIIPVTPGLHAQLEKRCLDCHDHEPGRLDLSRPELARHDVVDMLEAVTSGKMPKDAPLSNTERTQFLDSFIASTWAGPDAVAARSYYITGSKAIPAYRPEVAFALIHGIARATAPASWRMMENAVRPDLQQMTPGFVTVMALEAAKACREHHETREERARCISEALRLGNLTSK